MGEVKKHWMKQIEDLEIAFYRNEVTKEEFVEEMLKINAPVDEDDVAIMEESTWTEKKSTD